MSISISSITAAKLPAVQSFLHKNAETSLFLASNLTAYGPSLSDRMNSGNFKYLHAGDHVHGVFCLTRRGNLLAETGGNTDYAPAIIDACCAEPIRISGVVGEWQLASAIWQILIKTGYIANVLHTSRERLYRLALDKTTSPSSQTSSVQWLKPEDFDQWESLNSAYMREEGLPIQGTREQRRADFEESARKKHWWGIWNDGTLAAISALNAVHESMGQIGGVYTTPEQRRCGFGKRVMQTLISDCVYVHKLQKLLLFTGDKNLAAQRLYESLGFRQAGEFALLFGISRDSEVS